MDHGRARPSWLLILVAVAVTSTVDPAASSAWAQSSSVPAADGVAVVRSGTELAAAFANASVTLALILGSNLTLTDSDWDGVAWPVILKRNFTVQGINSSRTAWPLLRLPARQKVQLMDDVTLTLLHVVLEAYRADSFLRAPGLDMLMQSPPGTRSAMVIFTDAVAIINVCFPEALEVVNFAAVPRLPTAPPGAQNYTIGLSQPGCVNDTAAPLLDRCWPSGSRMLDFYTYGADIDSGGTPQLNFYGLALLNETNLCDSVLSDACIEAFGPIGCHLLTLRNLSSVPPPLLPLSEPYSPPASTGDAVVSSGSAPGAGEIAAIAGSIAGGVGFTCLVVGAFLIHRRRRSAAALALSSAAVTEPPDTLSKDPHKVLGMVVLRSNSTAFDASNATGRHQHPERTSRPCKPTAAAVITARTPIGSGVAKCNVVARSTDADSSMRSLIRALSDHQTTDSGNLDRQPSGDAGFGSYGSYAAEGAADAPPAAGDVVKLLPVLLGKGAFGRVYEGTFRGQRVAVKQVLDLYEGNTQEDSQAAIAQELDVLGRCEHPNILRVLAACLAPPRPCLVLELMDTSLDKLMYGKPPLAPVLLPLPLVLHIASEIAQGLAYLHPTILHRDLKPANVLISDPWGDQPIVKLSDFGLSRLRHTALITANPEAGTPAYIAPECYDVHNTRTTHQADIYACGVVLWEMLAGTRPWAGLGAVPIACQVTFLGRRLPVPPQGTPGSCSSRWPPQLCQLLDECWDPVPVRRPAAEELAKRLMVLNQKLELLPPQSGSE